MFLHISVRVEPRPECLLAAQCLIPSATQLLAQAENPISVGSIYFSTSNLIQPLLVLAYQNKQKPPLSC